MRESERGVLLFYVLLTALALGGVGFLLLVFREYGAGVYADSLAYTRAADHWLAGDGLVIDPRNPFLLWPPLYPLALAGGAFLLGQDALAAGALVNALCFGGTIFLSGWLFYKFSRGSWGMGLAGALLAGIAPPLFDQTVLILSEGLFIFLSLLAIALFTQYSEQKDLRWLLAAAVAVGLCALTRYLGAVLLGWGGLLILLSNWPDWKKSGAQGLIFLLVAGIPLALWFRRNYELSGTLTGARPVVGPALPEALAQTYAVLVNAFLPRSIPGREWIGIALGVSLLVLGLVLVAREIRAGRLRFTLPFVPGLFVLVYTGGLYLAARFGTNEPISQRFLSPILIPLGLLVGVALWHFTRGGLIRRVGILVLVGLWFAVLATTTFNQARDYMRTGGNGYNNAAWTSSPTVRYLQEQPLDPGLTVYSNHAWALIFLNDLDARTMPSKPSFAGMSETARRVALLKQFPNAKQSYLVWFKRAASYFFTPAELANYYQMELVQDLGDAQIYRVTKPE